MEFLDNLNDLSGSQDVVSSLSSTATATEVTTDEMCCKVFDFSEEVDNGWSVSTQNDPIVVTCNSDGQKFTIGGEDKHDEIIKHYEQNHVLKCLDKDIEEDLKRFSSVVTATDLDELKRKRCVVRFLYFFTWISDLTFLCLEIDFVQTLLVDCYLMCLLYVGTRRVLKLRLDGQWKPM